MNLHLRSYSHSNIDAAVIAGCDDKTLNRFTLINFTFLLLAGLPHRSQSPTSQNTLSPYHPAAKMLTPSPGPAHTIDG